MSTQNESSTSNNKTVMKGGGQDVSVGNPGVQYHTIDPQQPNYSQGFNRGSDIGSVTQGSNESFSGRSELTSNDHDLMSFSIDTPGSTDRVLFIADREMKLVSATFRVTVKGGASYAATLKKADSGTAIGSGTAIASAADISSAASNNTNISITPVEADSSVVSGQAVGLDMSGTEGSASGLIVTLAFRRTLEPSRINTFVE
jgi:hypothetical protein